MLLSLLRFPALDHKVEVVRGSIEDISSSFPRSFWSLTQSCTGRDGRVAEGARLESVFTRKGNVGSNPTLSASADDEFRAHGLGIRLTDLA